MIKNLFLLLVIFGLVSAIIVTPDHQGVRHSGDNRLPQLNTDFTVDCPTKTITATVSDEDDNPVSNAQMYVFYTNYGYQPIASGRANQQGVGQLNIVGNPNYLTALFILRTENPAYQSQEIEFTYEKCFGTVSDEEIRNPPAPPPPPVPPPTVNNTPPTPPPINNTPPPVVNQTMNNTPIPVNVSNQTQNTPQPSPSSGCKLPFAIFGFVLVSAIILRSKERQE